MLELEKQISDWREQMLAAGINSPAPLEELEIHLREEIQRQMKSGLNEQIAFEISVRKIGQPKALKNEFQKIERTSLKRSLMLMVGWLAACFVLLAALFRVEWILNLFNWHPELWDWNIPVSAAGVLASITAIWFLAKASRDSASRIVSLFVCFFLVWLGIQALPAEPLSNGLLGRSESSPLWYRSGLALLLCVPGILWFWWERRRAVQTRHSTHGSRYVRP